MDAIQTTLKEIEILNAEIDERKHRVKALTKQAMTELKRRAKKAAPAVQPSSDDQAGRPLVTS